MKLLRIFLGIILGLVILATAGGAIYYFAFNQEEPQSMQSKEADELAQKMLNALNYKALEKTRYLKWSFMESTDYLYDTHRALVNISWDVYQVELNLGDPQSSRVLLNDEPIKDEEERQELISTANKKFNNDSFWLLAPYKVFDEGTVRSIVELEDGKKGLMVEYTSGGDTPGDKYLWLLRDNGFPYAYRMWVQIIPTGGTEASWDDWMVTGTGLYLPKSHKIGMISISMGDVDGFN